MNKKIYFDPVGKVFGAHEELIRYPPEGYEFILHQATWEKNLSQSRLMNVILIRLADLVLPVHLMKAYLNAWLQKPPLNADLVLAYNHLVFGRKPWILWLEEVTRLAGFHIRHVRRFSHLIEKHLGSDLCKAVLVSSERVKKSILLNLDCARFEHKIRTIPLAVHSKDFVKHHDDRKIRLLFVSSDRSKSPDNFELKGGPVVIEAFTKLRQRYNNLELVVRSDVPPGIKEKCSGVAGITLIEEIIPWQQLEQLFTTADIFLYPAHESSWRVVLDAMSYELPVVATDVYENPEKVQNGKTGFLVRGAKHVPYVGENCLHAWGTSLRSQFERAYRIVDPDVVSDVVEKASILIENPELRRKMGSAARWEVEHGKFSIENRNRKLKQVFDEATNACGN